MPPIPSPLAPIPILAPFSSLPPHRTTPIIPSDSPPAGAIEPPSMAAELGLPPGFHFVPTDEEVVRFYLLPRILNQPFMPNLIIEDDPLSAPPWALLEKHGQKREAFFFAACQAMNAKGSRQKRTCVGHGTWKGQGKKRKAGEKESQEVKKKMRVRVRGRDKEMEVEWQKYGLNFHERGVEGSTGWVMHEYTITAPPELARSPVRVYCIRFSGHGRNAKKLRRDAQHWGSDDEIKDEEEVVDDAAGATANTTLSSAEEDAALLIEEYLAAFPLEEVDAVSANPADGGYHQADAGAGYHQAALVDDFEFMNSLPALPSFFLM